MNNKNNLIDYYELICNTYSIIFLFYSFFQLYIFRIPFLQLENAKGISSNYLKHLEKQLNELAFKILGEVMIFELIQYIQVI